MTHFVVAMACEARPLIDRYRLRAESDDSPYRLFRSEEHDLVISGVGRVAAAAATAYLAARPPSSGRASSSAWLNVGIAGHRSVRLGTALLAQRIENPATEEVWLPPRHFESPLAPTTLVCVDRVEGEYPEEAAYDMESAGFWPTANRFASAELVQCLKIVSDTPAEQVGRLTAERIEQLVAARLLELEELRSGLERLAAVAPAAFEPALDRFLESRRLSTTQRRRLRRLLQRWATMVDRSPEEAMGDALRAFREAPSGSGGTGALDHLERRLESLPVRLRSGETR